MKLCYRVGPARRVGSGRHRCHRTAEARIHTIELEIDAPIELLALHQPMASNLRFIIAALKINTDLERMGTWPQRSHTPRER